jgi:hypothetical protein
MDQGGPLHQGAAKAKANQGNAHWTLQAHARRSRCSGRRRMKNGRKKRHNSWFGICRHRTKNRTWFGNDTFFGSLALIVPRKQIVAPTAFWFGIAIRRVPLGTSSGRVRTSFFPRGCFGSFERLFQTAV